MEEILFDVVIVGSGTSAHYCALKLNQAGKKVAMVDEREYGGTCALRGCQPKKYLVANADAVAMAKHLVGIGIATSPQTNWQQLQKLKNEFTDGLSEEAVQQFEEAGIKTFHGHARMTGKDTIEVADTVLKGANIVLATGSTPRQTDIPGKEFASNSETFLNLPKLPKRIIFIGGGYISFEFATVATYAGSQVTILHRSDAPLKAFDRDAVSIVVDAARDSGINLVINESPVEIKKSGTDFSVKGKTGQPYEADLVIEASGRLPNLTVLEGDDHNVQKTPKGITVNEFLQSVSNPLVYAIGDVAASGYQLAPVADKEGDLAAENIIKGNTATLDYAVVPSAVFTIPNLATVGLNEKAADAKGLFYRVNSGSPTGWPSSKRIGEKHGYYKVIIESGSEKILGAHLVRHNASEVINVFALAIKHGLTAHDLSSVMWAYPTYTSDLKYMVK